MLKSDIGIYGMGVMGQNISINFANQGARASIFNRIGGGEEEVTKKFISNQCQDKKIIGTYDIKEFVDSIKQPRKILLMIKAGTAVDHVLNQLIPLLSKGDIVIDGGNSHHLDTSRRLQRMEQHDFYYVGCGISGGEKGALNGPAMMPGGSQSAWDQIKTIFQSIAARSNEGKPCCEWIGPEGSGHFVKMTHNGIEYAILQIIAEAYDIMRRMLVMPLYEISDVLSRWNNGELQSYLLKITITLLKMKGQDGQSILDEVLDCADHKGTGKNIAISGLELGIPLVTINGAINARYLSQFKSNREEASKKYTTPIDFRKDKQLFIQSLRDAVYCSSLIAYTEGISLMARASSVYDWNLNLGVVSRIWKNGCIIQSFLLNKIATVLQSTTRDNLLLEPSLVEILNKKQNNWRTVGATSIQNGIPIPVISSSLNYFDGLRSKRLPANLIQAQRDFFGAHGYEKVTAPRGIIFHLEDK